MTAQPRAHLAGTPYARAHPRSQAHAVDPDRIDFGRLVASLRDLLVEDARAENSVSLGVPQPSAAQVPAAQMQHFEAALGFLAFDCLAPRRCRTLAVIGADIEAELVLSAALDLRKYQEVRIYSRRPVAAAELARRYRRTAHIPFEICVSPEQALHMADAVILGSRDKRPIIDADWVAPGAHVSALSTQTEARHEVPRALVHRARLIVSDDPGTVRASRDHLLHGETALKRLRHLGGLLGTFDPDRDRAMTLFLPSGDPGLMAAAFDALGAGASRSGR